jgi:hypothetical protein
VSWRHCFSAMLQLHGSATAVFVTFLT